MKSKRVRIAVGIVAMLALAGCGTSSKSSASTKSGTTSDGLTGLPPTTTTVPAKSQLLSADELPKGWTSAGDVNYATVTGDQPSRCFYDLDQLDGGATSTSGAGFRYGGGPPFFTQVIFAFQPGASQPAVQSVYSALDGCGSFALPSADGTVEGAVLPVQLKLTGLDEFHVYSLGLKSSSSQTAVLILIGRKGDNVILSTYETGADVSDAVMAGKLFQMAIDKFTTGKIDPNGHATA